VELVQFQFNMSQPADRVKAHGVVTFPIQHALTSRESKCTWSWPDSVLEVQR